jgi:fatty acid elongase 3
MSTRAASQYYDLYDGFDWRSAPLSDMRAPLFAGAGYVVLVLLMNGVMPRLGGVDTKRLQAAHNMVLCIGSLAMTVGAGLEVVRRSRSEGSSRWLFCEAPSTEPRGVLWFWGYVYYLSKYYELLDTVLQLLKGRPPPHFALHVYHHAVVLVMAWGWVEYIQTLSFIGLLFNTSVHVVMCDGGPCNIPLHLPRPNAAYPWAWCLAAPSM